MKRLTIDLLTGASAIVLLAAAALWVRSYWIADGIGFESGLHLESERGQIHVEQLELHYDQGWEDWRPGRYAAPLHTDDNWREWSSRTEIDRHALGFEIYRGPRVVRRFDPAPELSGTWDFEEVRMISVPIWFVAAAALFGPAMRTWLLYRRRHLIKSNRCLACGYDLRASPVFCPECGKRSQGEATPL